MSLNKFFTKLFFILLLMFSASLANAGDAVSVGVGLHQAEVVKLPKEMTSVIIADRKIAGVVKHDGRTVSVVGHGLGKTDIRFMNGGRIVREVNLTVHPDLNGIKKSLNNFFPNESIGVDLVNDSVALVGNVSSAEVASKAEKIVKEYNGGVDVLNLMHLRSSQQVMLSVRVGELKRTEVKKFGLGVHGIISAGSAVFGALEKNGTFKVLAEPTLTAISGETANFLAGGEFPVPVKDGNNGVSVDYKKFGVSVDFTPQVLSENRVRLNVASEVSELSNEGKVMISSMNIPSIATRRANTTVELAPGESFMIAGLMKSSGSAILHEVPGLGDIPILNVLFRSTEFQNNQTELVIAVTPYLAAPVEGDDIRLPTDGYNFSGPLKAMFTGKLGGYDKNAVTGVATGGLAGPAGFMVE